MLELGRSVGSVIETRAALVVGGTVLAHADFLSDDDMGGGDLLGIPVGRLQVGKQFDAFAVDAAGSLSGLRRWDGVDTEERLFEKIVTFAGRRYRSCTGCWKTRRPVTGSPLAEGCVRPNQAEAH